ncbi:glycogen debranching protein [Roseivirga sp. BDSF3-8]|uniref:alpha-L-rhamnosidase-related protein n=1 Tax=Roseivirga sp. BDSF3-8 TaxID=3241598 RepID=UPI003531CCF6
MNRYALIFLVNTFFFSACQVISLEKPEDVIYKGQDYTVYKDRVTQGRFVAEAVSPTRITSNYKSPANQRYPRNIEFKFSLNGKDNELPAGVNHHLVLRPENGRVVAPVITFGQADAETPASAPKDFLEPNTELLIRVDMRHVLKSFEEKGYYESYDGSRLAASDFRGVWVAGNAAPLTWDFENLPSRSQFQLKDPDEDGIYETSIILNAYDPDNFNEKEWVLGQDISGLPAYTSDQLLVDALYNMSLEEMLLNIRQDSAFMAGEKWEGVWTRDISYSILLSLAMVAPDIAKKSLMHKVRNGRIVQDTGTGGSWPVSTDRTTWALAAYEVYLFTGDREWLAKAFEIISASVADDQKVIFDKRYGLARGESSFLDWRKQSYPRWMGPVDIYESLNLGTNAVHFRTYQILALMAEDLGMEATAYIEQSERIKDGINAYMWMEEKGYYGQYLYGKHFLSLSPRSESLGEALTVLFGIAENDRATSVVENTPVLNYGVPSIYPQIPGIPPYHNDAIWPFVQAYYTWAAARTNNTEGVNLGMNSLYRHAAFFLTNKENLVAHSADYRGTELNSDRQLWSVAGNLAMVYRILFGMEMRPEGIYLSPIVPMEYGGKRTLSNFTYRNARLTIEMEGFGNEIASFAIDGVVSKEPLIPAGLSGTHTITIRLADRRLPDARINLLNNHFSPDVPDIEVRPARMTWKGKSEKYIIIRNGSRVEEVKGNDSWKLDSAGAYRELSVVALDKAGVQGFQAEPLAIYSDHKVMIIEAESQGITTSTDLSGYTGKSYREISKEKNRSLDYTIQVPRTGNYLLDIRYSNGSGPVNTDNKCAIRSLYVDGAYQDALIFPQLGYEEWSTWGYSNKVAVNLSEGTHMLMLRFDPHNENMNGEVNRAMIDHIRLIPLEY